MRVDNCDGAKNDDLLRIKLIFLSSSSPFFVTSPYEYKYLVFSAVRKEKKKSLMNKQDEKKNSERRIGD